MSIPTLGVSLGIAVGPLLAGFLVEGWGRDLERSGEGVCPFDLNAGLRRQHLRSGKA
jgi:MFS family permease